MIKKLHTSYIEVVDARGHPSEMGGLRARVCESKVRAENERIRACK